MSLTLPPNVPAGAVEVIILVDETKCGSLNFTNDPFEELMVFHKGNRLGGISLEELVTEGRRCCLP